jgi:hypothetical protein
VAGLGAVLIQLARVIPGWVSSGWKANERRMLAQVAQDLAYLAFWHDGMRAPLARIAEGKGTPTDIDELMSEFNKTEAAVRDAAGRLRSAREKLVATKLGMPVARSIDKVLWLKVGPENLRPQLRTFAEARVCDQATADYLMREIDAFNADLDEAHSMILDTGATFLSSRKPAAGKKRVAAKP